MKDYKGIKQWNFKKIWESNLASPEEPKIQIEGYPNLTLPFRKF